MKEVKGLVSSNYKKTAIFNKIAVFHFGCLFLS